jgi:hypothetical protein
LAAITVTPASVIPDAGYQHDTKLAGETITAGQALYLKASDDRYWLAQADGTAPEAECKGIALNAAAAGQPVRALTSGVITIGGTVAIGTIYVLGATPGAIYPAADLASGDRVTTLGIGTTAAKIAVKFHVSGVQVPA